MGAVQRLMPACNKASFKNKPYETTAEQREGIEQKAGRRAGGRQRSGFTGFAAKNATVENPGRQSSTPSDEVAGTDFDAMLGEHLLDPPIPDH